MSLVFGVWPYPVLGHPAVQSTDRLVGRLVWIRSPLGDGPRFDQVLKRILFQTLG